MSRKKLKKGPICTATKSDGTKCTTLAAKQGEAARAGLCGPHWYATQPRKQRVVGVAAHKNGQRDADVARESNGDGGANGSANGHAAAEPVADRLRWLLHGEKRGYIPTRQAIEQIRAELGDP